jgi:hypothetical protein
MSEAFQLWLFGIVIGALFVLAGAIYLLAQRQTKIETIFNFWIETIGAKAANILHSPGDHLGLDKYLDKYLHDHPQMTLEDWVELKLMCEKVEKDECIDSGKRLVAGFFAAGAIHKIMLITKNLPTHSELRQNPVNGEK